MKIVIIGGVAGGASAAARARRHSEAAEIIVLERGPDVSFANCGLPYHIGGEIEDRGELAVQTPDSLKAILNLDVRTGHEAIGIDRMEKQVLVRKSGGSEESITYDKLVLAPGAAPFRPPIPGIDDSRILTLRDLQDMDRIIAAAKGTDHVAIIGAGFIGLEMAEQLQRIGKKVTVIEKMPQVLPPADPEFAEIIEHELRRHGIEVHTGDEVTAFEPDGDDLKLKLGSGGGITAGAVILSIGVRPESGLASEAKLDCGPRGHITVNQYQQTNDPDIYAVRDVVEAEAAILGGKRPLPLGGPANRQGRTAADHIFLGEKALAYPGSLGTAIVRVFDQTVAVTGYGEPFLKMREVACQTVTVNGVSHADYYPGAEIMKLKLLWSPDDGRILGAQAIGGDGVDKRIDVIATAMRGKMTIEDLCHLELTYAPPFGNAKDPVNIAGFAACNVRDGYLKPQADIPTGGEQIVDVRPPAKAESQPVPGAVNIPLGQLRERHGELDASRPVYTMCQMGKTSYFAARILDQNGFDARSILGGAELQLNK